MKTYFSLKYAKPQYMKLKHNIIIYPALLHKYKSITRVLIYYIERKQKQRNKKSSRVGNRRWSTTGARKHIQSTPDPVESLNLDLSMQTQGYQKSDLVSDKMRDNNMT